MTESTYTFQNLPSYFTGKIVVTTKTTKKEYVEEIEGKITNVVETETVTTYEHINADYNLIPTR